MRRKRSKAALLLAAALLAGCSTLPRDRAALIQGFGTHATTSAGLEEISVQAIGLVGVPYRWGGNTPTGGFDCSGFVGYVVRQAAGIKLPRTVAEISTRGVALDPPDVAPGDLLFFDTQGGPYSHVGIYVGHFRFAHAPSAGGTVRLDDLRQPYWTHHYTGARRVVTPRAVAANPPREP